MVWLPAAGYAAAWLLLVIAAGGAASAGGRVAFGAPTLAALALATAAVSALALACGASGGRLLLGLAPLLLALLTAAPLPGLRALGGAPLLALVAAAAALAVATTGRRPPARAFVPAVLVLFAVVSLRVQAQVGPEGDEPHYLMVADSLLRDGDLSLERDYAEGRYGAFYPRALQPHYRVRGKDGAVYSLHALGLSLLILPAYALGGYPAVSFFMAGLAAWLAREVRELAREWTADAARAEAIGWLVALSPPLVHYAGLVFTEVPAALLVALALRSAARVAQPSLRAALVCAAALALLPWLNVRYALVAAIVFAYALTRRPSPRALAVLFAAPLVSAAALALHHWRLYGFFDPRRVYGRRPEFSLPTLRDGLPGLLLDQEFGLLVYAPFLVLAVPGAIRLWRGRRAEAAAAGAVVLSVLLVAGSWHMWRGGFNPPARFLVPALPVLAVAAAAALRPGLGAAAALLAGWSVWAGLAGGWDPRLVHRDRDGTAPFFRAHSGAEEWTRLLPGYVLADPDRHRLAALWGVALGGAVALATRPPRPRAGAVAASCAGIAAAAAIASWASTARAGGREAVRVVGRPALTVPGWRVERRAVARWGPADLGWGQVFEPHRHPDGAILGDRLALRGGRYRLWLEVEDLSPGTPPGDLLVRPDGTAAARRTRLRRGMAGFEADVEVHEGERAVTLLVRGGGPFRLKEARLGASTF